MKTIIAKERKSSIDYITMYLMYFYKYNTLKAILITLCYIFMALLPAAMLLISKSIFELMSVDKVIFENVAILILLLTAIKISNRIIKFLNVILIKNTEGNLYLKINQDIVAKTNKIKLTYFEDPELMNLLSRTNNNAPSQIINGITNFFQLISSFIEIVSCSIVLVEVHLIIPIILIIGSFPYILFYRKMNFDNYFMEINQTKHWRKNWYLIKLMFEKQTNKELKFYNLFGYLADKQEKINYELNSERYKMSKKYAILGILLDISKTLIKYVCVLFTINLIFNGLNISSLVIVLQAMDNMQNSLLIGYEKIKSINSGFLFMNDFFTIKNLEEEVESNHDIEMEKNFSIEFKNVDFQYPHSTKKVLKNINVEIKSNEKIAIVGENGSGKTTFINLLLGFYNPIKGEIVVNKKFQLKDVIESIRKNTTYIMQNFIRYNFSIKDNILMGRKINSNLYNDNLNKFGLRKFIESLTNNDQTLLGVINSDGQEISGGEWQRIAIARGCLNNENKLYILDEPTAAVDPILESEIYKQFNEITANKTTIFISHRLGITQLVDKILVFKDGEIIEAGNHKELMSLNGVYYEMFNAQKQLYI